MANKKRVFLHSDAYFAEFAMVHMKSGVCGQDMEAMWEM